MVDELLDLCVAQGLFGLRLPGERSIFRDPFVNSVGVRIDILVRDAQTGANLAVLDTKYKNVDQPSMQDIQQAAFYADQMGVNRAFLIHPSRSTAPLWVRNGGVTIQTLVFDLAQPLEEAGQIFLAELESQLAFTAA